MRSITLVARREYSEFALAVELLFALAVEFVFTLAVEFVFAVAEERYLAFTAEELYFPVSRGEQ